jgi:hypothetical protein
MDYTKLFYWLVVADNARTLFVTLITVFMVITIASTMGYLFNLEKGTDAEENRHHASLWMRWSYPFVIVFWMLYIFTPSKRDSLLIIAGGQTLNFLTTNESTKQIPAELSGFILSELKNMAADAKVELGVLSEKEKILEEAKQLTSDELIKRMAEDANFADIILQRK